jgi:hypothetical protein
MVSARGGRHGFVYRSRHRAYRSIRKKGKTKRSRRSHQQCGPHVPAAFPHGAESGEDPPPSGAPVSSRAERAQQRAAKAQQRAAHQQERAARAQRKTARAQQRAVRWHDGQEDGDGEGQAEQGHEGR